MISPSDDMLLLVARSGVLELSGIAFLIIKTELEGDFCVFVSGSKSAASMNEIIDIEVPTIFASQKQL